MRISEALLMVIAKKNCVLWSNSVDSGTSSRFHIGNGEALPMDMVTIFV